MGSDISSASGDKSNSSIAIRSFALLAFSGLGSELEGEDRRTSLIGENIFPLFGSTGDKGGLLRSRDCSGETTRKAGGILLETWLGSTCSTFLAKFGSVGIEDGWFDCGADDIGSPEDLDFSGFCPSREDGRLFKGAIFTGGVFCNLLICLCGCWRC